MLCACDRAPEVMRNGIDKVAGLVHSKPSGEVSLFAADARRRRERMLEPGQSLYHRLGGYDAIAAFTDEFLARVIADPQLGVYWRGKCKDSLRKERQLLVDFLSAASGGPVNYSGRDMKTSHEGLAISESDWEVMVRHATSTLDDLGVAENERNEALSFVDALKADIVEVKHGVGAHA
jgi:hemoglobin